RHHLDRSNARRGGHGAPLPGRGCAPNCSTFGSDHGPLTEYSYERVCPTGSFNRLCATAAPTPNTGLTNVAIAVTPRRMLGTTRTYRLCVSFSRLTSPRMSISAADARIFRSVVLRTPFCNWNEEEIRSNGKPLAAASLKLSASSDRMRPMPEFS